MAERFYVEFTKSEADGYGFWELTFDTLEEAQEVAEVTVEDGEADSAHITARDNTVYLTYTLDGMWEAD